MLSSCQIMEGVELERFLPRNLEGDRCFCKDGRSPGSDAVDGQCTSHQIKTRNILG